LYCTVVLLLLFTTTCDWSQHRLFPAAGGSFAAVIVDEAGLIGLCCTEAVVAVAVVVVVDAGAKEEDVDDEMGFAWNAAGTLILPNPVAAPEPREEVLESVEVEVDGFEAASNVDANDLVVEDDEEEEEEVEVVVIFVVVVGVVVGWSLLFETCLGLARPGVDVAVAAY
jgi:hypothetical protein